MGRRIFPRLMICGEPDVGGEGTQLEHQAAAEQEGPYTLWPPNARLPVALPLGTAGSPQSGPRL